LTSAQHLHRPIQPHQKNPSAHFASTGGNAIPATASGTAWALHGFTAAPATHSGWNTAATNKIFLRGFGPFSNF
jgi:hypothetical protein